MLNPHLMGMINEELDTVSSQGGGSHSSHSSSRTKQHRSKQKSRSPEYGHSSNQDGSYLNERSHSSSKQSRSHKHDLSPDHDGSYLNQKSSSSRQQRAGQRNEKAMLDESGSLDESLEDIDTSMFNTRNITVTRGTPKYVRGQDSFYDVAMESSVPAERRSILHASPIHEMRSKQIIDSRAKRRTGRASNGFHGGTRYKQELNNNDRGSARTHESRYQSNGAPSEEQGDFVADDSNVNMGGSYSMPRHRIKEPLSSTPAGPRKVRTVSNESFEVDQTKIRKPKDMRTLRKIQDELEEQRDTWKDEVAKMMEGVVIKDSPTIKGGTPTKNETNSYIDNIDGSPVFRAFFDMSEYPPSSISLHVDSLQNKIIVQASKAPGDGSISRDFTQKVQLPKYADDNKLRYYVRKDGILAVEVPLIFYFPGEKKKTKSFINQVVTNPDGSRRMEILVNLGEKYRPWNVQVQVVDDDKLIISAVKTPESSPEWQERKQKAKLIKRYSLPPNTDYDKITSKMGDDGRLCINVPFYPPTP